MRLKNRSGGDRELTVAIIGLAHLHPRSYMPLFQSIPGVKVVAVVEKDENLRKDFCRDFGVTGFADLEDFIAAGGADIAAIFLPHADCPDAAVRCARAGMHLMMEKPVASGAEGARRIVEAAGKAGVLVTAGYCWRMHPAAREIRRMIQNGWIGQVVGGEGRCAAGRLSRYIEGKSAWMLDSSVSGGGPMYNLGVHWIDLFRWALGDEVEAVSGCNVKVNERYDIEDNSFAHLRFSKGAVVALDISYTVPDSFPHGRDLYVAFRGTRGVISWAPAYEGERDIVFVCSDAPELAGSPIRRIEFNLQPVKGYSGYMGSEYVRSFVAAVRERMNPPISGEDAVAVLDVVEAIYDSARSGKWEKVRRPADKRSRK